jgi:hypothetical protein
MKKNCENYTCKEFLDQPQDYVRVYVPTAVTMRNKTFRKSVCSTFSEYRMIDTVQKIQ